MQGAVAERKDGKSDTDLERISLQPSPESWGLDYHAQIVYSQMFEWIQGQNFRNRRQDIKDRIIGKGAEGIS